MNMFQGFGKPLRIQISNDVFMKELEFMLEI